MLNPIGHLNPAFIANLPRGGVVIPTLVGDLSGGAEGAWGVRRNLIGTYEGPIFRGRNTTTNAEADIDAATAFDDVYALSDSGNDVVVVPKLYDHTGNGRHIVHATAARQPLIYDPFVDSTALYGVNSPAYGYATLLFDNIDDVMRTPDDATWTGKDTLFLVFAQWAHTAGDIVVGGRTQTQFKLMQQTGSSPDIRMYMNGGLTNSGFAVDTLALATCRFGDPTGAFRENEETEVTGGMGTGTDARGWGIGGSWSDGFSHCGVEFTEMIVWNSDLSAGDQTPIREEMVAEYGL